MRLSGCVLVLGAVAVIGVQSKTDFQECAQGNESTNCSKVNDERSREGVALRRSVIIRILWASAESMLRVAMIGSVGAGLAWQGALDATGRKSVARVLTYGLLPMLLFTKVSSAVCRAGTQIVQWLVLPLYAAVHVCLGLSIAHLLWRLFTRTRKRSDVTSFSVLPSEEGAVPPAADPADSYELPALISIAVSFPNSGALPLALVESLCASSAVRAIGGPERCLPATVGYISFYIAMLNPLQWIVAPRLLRASIYHSEGSDQPVGWRVALRRRLASVPPPVLAAILGACVGASPRVYEFALGDGKTVVGSALETVGNAAVPVGIINLGAAIFANTGFFRAPSAPTKIVQIPGTLLFSAGFVRLVLIPALSIGVTASIRNYFSTPISQPPLALVVMLEACPPPAMQLMVFIQLFSLTHLEIPTTQLLVSIYFASLLTLTAWISVILAILSQPVS